MTKFAKVLVVATVVGCLAWLGFVMATLAGGYHWQNLTRERPELRDYEFSLTEGDNPVWQARLRGSTQTVATDPNLAKVILQVERDVEQRQNAILNGSPTAPGLPQQIAQLQQLLEQTQQFRESDRVALAAYEQQLQQDLLALQQQIVQASEEVAKLAQQVELIQTEAAGRRADVYRLRQLAQELEADRERLASLQQRLRDRIVQGKADVEALRRRAEQLAESRPAQAGSVAQRTN